MQEIFDIRTYDTPCTLNMSSLFPDFKGNYTPFPVKLSNFFDAPQYYPILCCRRDFQPGLCFETHTKLKIVVINCKLYTISTLNARNS